MCTRTCVHVTIYEMRRNKKSFREKFLIAGSVSISKRMNNDTNGGNYIRVT